MRGTLFACVIALACLGANATTTNEDFPLENVETSVSFARFLFKALRARFIDFDEMFDVDDQDLEDINLLDVFGGRNALANVIRNALEGFRNVIVNGNDNIPPLDPLVFDHLGPFVFTHTGVRLTGNVRNFRMEGLSWYVVNDVSVNALRMTVGVGITVPWLAFTGSYDASAFIAFLSHRAAGNYRLFISRIDVDVDARIGTNILGGHLTLRNLDIRIDVHDVQINITGMTGSSLLNGIINNVAQTVTREFINSEMENVSRLISDALFDVVNDILRDFTLDDLRVLTFTNRNV